MRRVSMILAAVAGLAPCAARAQAQTAAPVTRSADALAEDAAIDTWINNAAGEREPLSSEDTAAGPAPRRIHGEVGATMGSHGYRSAYGYVTVPVGQASLVSVAASDSQWRSGRWGGSGEQRSLALGIYLDGSDIGRLFHRGRRCDIRQWAIGLHNDPVLNEDGTCGRAP